MMQAWPGQKVGGQQDPIIAPADPYRQSAERRADFGQQRDVYEDSRNYERQTQQDLVQNEQSLRKEFYSLPAVKEYQVAARTYANSLAAGDDASGDQSLIVAYAKMLDPNSVVREGEAAAVAGTDSTIGRSIATLSKEFGLKSGGSLSPDIRKKIRREMKTLAENYGAAYNQERTQFTDYASSYGFEPNRIVGQDIIAPYKEQIDAYWAAQEQPTARDPSNKDIYAGGIRYGNTGSDAAFDRSEYLQKTYGLEGDDEAKVIAFWNVNRGNRNLSPQAVKDWYAGQGLSAPSEADIEKAIVDAQGGEPFQGIDTKAAEENYLGQLDDVLAQRGADPESTSGTIGINATQGVLLQGADEIAGIGGALNAALTGQNPIAGYQAERDVIRRETERAKAANPKTAIASELGGAVITGGAGFGNAARASALAGKAALSGDVVRASNLGRTAVRASVAPGATTGAIYGFNSGNGVENSLVTGTTGAFTGALVAPALQAGMNKLTPVVGNALSARSAPTTEQRAIIEAGTRRDVPVRRPDVIPETRNERSALRTSEKAGPMIQAAERQDAEALERAVARDVAGGRASVGREGVGNTGATAVNRKRDSLYNEAKAFYTRADNAAGGKPMATPDALSTLDSKIAELTANGANANKKTIKYLRGVREDFANGLSVAGLRDQRTNLRANIREAGLDLNKTEALMLDVIDSASADLQRGLAKNPKALRAYKEGDRLWAERAQFTKEVRNKILGPRGNKSPESVADSIKNLARDDFGTFRKFTQTLDPDEAADIAATFAISQGRDNAGNWSPARFVSDLTGSDLGTKASISPQAQRLLFGKEGMQAIEDIKLLSRAKKDAASETNFSRTGNVVQTAAKGLRGLMLTAFGFASGGPMGAVAAPAAEGLLRSLGEKRAARLLLNPDFTKWLKSVPNATSPQAIDRQFARLNSIASRSPVMAADVKALQQTLMEAFAQSPTRAAAEGQQVEDGR